MDSPRAPANRALVFIFLTVFLDLLGVGILVPVIPYIVAEFRSDALTVGLLSLTFAAAQFLASPVLGAISDRVGRRTVLLLSVFGTGVGYFIFGFAGTLWLLFLARLLDGFTGGNISTAQAYIADVSPPEDRAKNFGLVGAAFGLGFIIGPALGGILSHWSLRAPAFAAGILSLVTMTLGYFILPESLPPAKRVRTPFRLTDLHPLGHLGEAIRRPGVRRIFVAFFAISFAMAGLQSNYAVYTREQFGLGPQGTAWLFTMVGIISVVVQGGLLRRIPTSGRERAIAMGGLSVMALGFAGTAFAPAVLWLYPATALLAFGNASAAPMLTAEVSRSVSAAEQGTILGSMQSVASLTRILGPLWAGLAFDHVGHGAPYWTGALWVVAGLGAASLSFRPADRAPLTS
jgi:DHA1 family tetracycline resistance protein-like MFS transporter